MAEEPEPEDPPVAEEPQPEDPPVAEDPEPEDPPVAEDPGDEPQDDPIAGGGCPWRVADGPSSWWSWRTGGGRLSLEDLLGDGRWWPSRTRGRAERQEPEAEDPQGDDGGRLTLADLLGGQLDGFSPRARRVAGRFRDREENDDDAGSAGERTWSGAFDVRFQNGFDDGPSIEIVTITDYV